MAEPGADARPAERWLHVLREHEGPWTEEAYLALDGAARRIELLDGSLLMSPAGDGRAARAAARLRAVLERAVPEALAVAGPLPLRVAPSRIVWPDLVVGRPHQSVPGNARDAADVLLVVDVAGRGELVDQVVMPQLYADGGIPYYLRLDPDAPLVVAHMLVAGRHREFVRADAGERLVLEDPFPLEIDLDAVLAEASAPARPDQSAP